MLINVTIIYTIATTEITVMLEISRNQKSQNLDPNHNPRATNTNYRELRSRYKTIVI